MHDPRHHRHDQAGHRQRPDRHADAAPDAGAARPDRPRRPKAPTPTSTPTPDGNEKPGAPNRTQSDSEPDSSTRAREGQGNQTFRAGNINGKKLVGKVERAARKKARK